MFHIIIFIRQLNAGTPQLILMPEKTYEKNQHETSPERRPTCWVFHVSHWYDHSFKIYKWVKLMTFDELCCQVISSKIYFLTDLELGLSNLWIWLDRTKLMIFYELSSQILVKSIFDRIRIRLIHYQIWYGNWYDFKNID